MSSSCIIAQLTRYHAQAIDIFLGDYALCKPHVRPVLTAADDSCAIALQLSSRRSRPTPQVRVEPGVFGADSRNPSELLEISPTIFALPADAHVRFRRLLKTFPTLEPTSSADKSIRSSSEQVKATMTDDLGDGRGAQLIRAHRRVREREKAAREPKWLLLGQASFDR